MRRTSDEAIKYCDSQINAELAQARAEERARIAAIRKREAAARAARAAALAAEQVRVNRARRPLGSQEGLLGIVWRANASD